MAVLRVSASSKEYLKVAVNAVKNGAVYDPTGDTVEFAFTSGDELGSPTWYAASWESMGGQHYARCLIGPGGGVVALAIGFWWVWVRVTDSPEIPIKQAGVIEVF
jgi:hypothetical protein